MRVVVLWAAVAIGLGVFVVMLASMWRYRRTHATTPVARSAAEYVWALIPCLIVTLCTAPAVHHVLVGLNR